jgi:hypothetical protein
MVGGDRFDSVVAFCPLAGALANVVRSAVRVGQGRSSGRYFAEVEYRYKVAGELYYGTRITFGEDPSFSSAAEASALVARFPVFGTVPARYNPSSPNVSVLLPGQLPPDFKSRALPFGAGFLIWLLLGLGLLRRTFNHSLQRTASPSAEF